MTDQIHEFLMFPQIIETFEDIEITHITIEEISRSFFSINE